MYVVALDPYHSCMGDIFLTELRTKNKNKHLQIKSNQIKSNHLSGSPLCWSVDLLDSMHTHCSVLYISKTFKCNSHAL